MAYKQSPINFGKGTGSSPLRREKNDRSAEGMMDARELVESNAPPAARDDEATFGDGDKVSSVDNVVEDNANNEQDKAESFRDTVMGRMNLMKKKKKGKKRRGGFLGGIFGKRRRK